MSRGTTRANSKSKSMPSLFSTFTLKAFADQGPRFEGKKVKDEVTLLIIKNTTRLVAVAKTVHLYTKTYEKNTQNAFVCTVRYFRLERETLRHSPPGGGKTKIHSLM